MESVLGDVQMFLMDTNPASGGQGVVPYLPLNELRRQPPAGDTQ
jgi:membrane protease subunit HflK